jgi:large repetitive protein
MLGPIRQVGAAICAAFLAASAYSQVPTAGLIAFYPLDGNGNDAGGNQLHGTATDVVPTVNRAGQANAALEFNGTTAYIDCGNPLAFNFEGSFTIAAWVKTYGNQVNKYVVAKYDYPNSNRSYGLGTSGNTFVYGFVMGEGPGYVDGSGGASLNDGLWHAIALVYDVTAGISLFIDGVNVRQVAAPGLPPFVNSVPLMIGRTFSGQPFQGAIDDVRLYNRALSNAEISQLGPPPEIRIIVQPNEYFSAPGGKVSLRVGATTVGTSEPVTYQWFRNGVAIADATNATLAVTSSQPREDLYRADARAGALVESSREVKVTFASPADAKLLAHYSFDNDGAETIVDSSGNFPGVPTNVEHAAGRVGRYSLRFNGASSSSSVRIPYPASPLDLAGTPYTIAWWMKVETNVIQQILWMGEGADNVGGYGFSVSASAFGWVHNTGSDPTFNASFRILTNWQHVAMVWDGFNRTLYTNAVVQARFATTNAIVSERNDDLFLGSRNGTNAFFRGLLDDLRIYNYALAGDEIFQLAQAQAGIGLSITLRSNDLLLSWPFVDASFNYRVEYVSTLGAGETWTPVSGITQRTGDTFSISQPIPTSARFYRLRRL